MKYFHTIFTLSHFSVLVLLQVSCYSKVDEFSNIGKGQVFNASVYFDGGKLIYKPGVLDKNAAGYALFNDTLHVTGWGVLDIVGSTGPKISTNQAYYAAGYLEGALTSKHMWAHYLNSQGYFFKESRPETRNLTRKFFDKQDAWMRSMIKQNPKDAYWVNVGYIVSQYDGLVDGYLATAKKEWDRDKFVVQVLNGVGDLIDLIKAIDPPSQPDVSNMTHKEFRLFVQQHGHCSALVKVLGAYENLFMSHSSWFVYGATNRIYKHYNFNVTDSTIAAKKISFSSYPGFLESLDDFYLLSSKLVLLQTTNNVFNLDLYKLVTSQSLFAWHRVRVANHMALNGSQWYDIFKKHNSGTYNNQYMVIDLKQIQLEQSVNDGALWVVEQIPGYTEGHDQTPILRTGYWPSYNVPFYEEVYNRSGYPDIVKARGTDFSYQLAPRAKIFRRDQNDVQDMASMKDIMRYNDFYEDPYSESNACDTICCRGDLLDEGASPDGCYDTKVSDYKMAMNAESFVINGPTRSHHLPPFRWIEPFANISHVGLPEVYNFNWQAMSPTLGN